jgi:hypothetical protein
VAVSVLVGVFLAVVPWTALWETNYLLQPYPQARAWVLSAFTRGTITGLGLVNVLLAIDEARAHLRARGLRG